MEYFFSSTSMVKTERHSCHLSPICFIHLRQPFNSYPGFLHYGLDMTLSSLNYIVKQFPLSLFALAHSFCAKIDDFSDHPLVKHIY